MDAQVVEAVLKAHFTAVRQRLDEAVSIAKAAEACATAGNIEKAIEIAMDVEQLIFEVNTFLSAASLMKRMDSP